MNKLILNTGVQTFIRGNLNTDIVSVLLKKPAFEGITQHELAQQIESRKKCQKKLPSWFETEGIYYPKKQNIEQTSSEITADYKAKIVSGQSLIDLTGGLGIDSYYFAQKIDHIIHCEIDAELHEIAVHNFKMLGAVNIQSLATDGLHFLGQAKQKFEWIYVDPSRRSETKGRVYRLGDCQPNVIENLGLFFEHSNNILLKTAPLFDISIGLKTLKGVKEIHIVAVDNDVKEVLWVLQKDYFGEAHIQTTNVTKGQTQVYHLRLSQEKAAHAEFSPPLSYLYEPNAAILKSGGFKRVGADHNVKKLHPHTHLYTADELCEFPGRRFKVLQTVPYNTKGIRALQLTKANVATRNFPDSVAVIRKKFKLKDGGQAFLFFYKNYDDKYQVALCQKV